MSELKPIESAAELFEVLRAELEYCACAYEDTVPVLRELLGRVVKRSDSASGHDGAFGRATRALEEWLFEQASSGMASWIVCMLERAGFLFHGAHVLDVWITDRGRWLCAALERFPEPAPRFAGTP